MFDWQAVAVALIILAALLYVTRRGWARLRSFRAGNGEESPVCAAGCGGCGGSKEPAGVRPEGGLVQIQRGG